MTGPKRSTFEAWFVVMIIASAVALIFCLLSELGEARAAVVAAQKRAGVVEGAFTECVSAGRQMRGLYVDCTERHATIKSRLTSLEEKCSGATW